MGSENHTVNIMYYIYDENNNVGLKLLAAAQTRLETSGPIHAELRYDFHLQIKDFRCSPFIWATYIRLRLHKSRSCLNKIHKMLQRFYSSSVAASLLVPKLFSYKGMVGAAASVVDLDEYLKKHHSLWNLTSQTNGFEFPHTVKLLNTTDRVAQKQGQQLYVSQLTSISGHDLNWCHLLLRIPGKKHSLKIS